MQRSSQHTRPSILRAKALGSLVMDGESSDSQQAKVPDFEFSRRRECTTRNDTHICDQQSNGYGHQCAKRLEIDIQLPEKLLHGGLESMKLLDRNM